LILILKKQRQKIAAFGSSYMSLALRCIERHAKLLLSL